MIILFFVRTQERNCAPCILNGMEYGTKYTKKKRKKKIGKIFDTRTNHFRCTKPLLTKSSFIQILYELCIKNGN